MTMKKIEKIEADKPILTKKLRVAAYARVSVIGEDKEHSLAAQTAYFSKLISSNPLWENAGIFADYGISGTKTSRPGFQALMDRCKTHQIDLILTKSISRFARNTEVLLSTIRMLKALDVGVVFEREDLDTRTTEGELMLTLLAGFAQAEAQSVSENCRWKIRKNFEKGIGNWFHLYGYKFKDGHFEIVESEAEVLRLIFSLYLTGYGTTGIIHELDKRGIRRRDGEPFTYTRITKILRQEKYCGDSLLQKTYRDNYLTKRKKINHGELTAYYAQGTHPAIISVETFNKVQAEIMRRAELGYRANTSTNFSALTGKIVCGECGKTYRRRAKGTVPERFYYKCSSKIEQGSASCGGINISEKLLYQMLSDVLETDNVSPEAIIANISRIIIYTPNKAIFQLLDGKETTRFWKFNKKSKKYEVQHAS